MSSPEDRSGHRTQLKKSSDFTDLKQRLNDLGARLGDSLRPENDPEQRARDAANGLKRRLEDLGARLAGRWQTEDEFEKAAEGAANDRWREVRALYTRDVTSRGLRDLVDEEPRESFRYFTRQIDFDALRDRPFWERIPMATWQIFQAMAYRLSPARRLLFAVGVPVVAVAWVRFILDSFGGGGLGFRVDWTLVAATLLLFLLVLELRDKLALKGDLEIAREIQFGLLPFEPFSRGKVTVNSMMRPANTVGGDYFDLIELGDGRIGLVMADVAGKGIPAALLMALLQASLRTLLTASLRGAELIAKLNEHLHSYIPSNRLITLFYAELDPETGDVSYVNAGHNPPLLVGSGGVSRLHSTGLVLGVVPDGDYEMRRTQLEEGDRLVLYTDGATEAFNRQDEEYGEERLIGFLAGQRHLPAEALLSGLVANVLEFSSPVRPRDDMTVMVVACDSPASTKPGD